MLHSAYKGYSVIRNPSTALPPLRGSSLRWDREPYLDAIGRRTPQILALQGRGGKMQQIAALPGKAAQPAVVLSHLA